MARPSFIEPRINESKMQVSTFAPSPALSAFIDKYVIVESERERINRLLPETSMAMAFRLWGQTDYLHNNATTTLPQSIISGLRKTPRLVKYLPKSATLIVLFKTLGAMAFFREPLHELFEETAPLDLFINRETVQQVEEQLAASSNHGQRIGVIENFLESHLRYSHDPLVANAVSQIANSYGSLRINDLASALHLSQDAFEKRFRKAVGSTAKQFSMIMRMKAVIHSQPHTSITDLALNSGYFDSAHFNKDFKLFTGLTPKEFFSTPLPW